MSLANGQADSVANTLAQGAGGDFNTGGVMGLGVAGSDAVDLLLCVLELRYWVGVAWDAAVFQRTRKAFRSSIVRPKPYRCSRAYWSMQPWPLLGDALVRITQGAPWTKPRELAIGLIGMKLTREQSDRG